MSPTFGARQDNALFKYKFIKEVRNSINLGFIVASIYLDSNNFIQLVLINLNYGSTIVIIFAYYSRELDYFKISNRTSSKGRSGSSLFCSSDGSGSCSYGSC